MAWKEIRLVMCTLLQRLTFRFAEGFDPANYRKDARDFFNLEVGRVPAVIALRTTGPVV